MYCRLKQYSGMQLALAGVYFILPLMVWSSPLGTLLLTDGSTVFQLSPGETNKYDFLSHEIPLLINSMQLGGGG